MNEQKPPNVSEPVQKTRELEDWLHHSLRLIVTRVAKIDELIRDHKRPVDTPAQQARLRYELQMITYCVRNRAQAETFVGEYAVWWAWLTQHAALQVERYAGRLSDQEFYAACMRLLQERDMALGLKSR